MQAKRIGSNIRRSPQEERPREKLLQHGPEQLSDAELLGLLLLGSGVRGCSAVELAGSLLAHFGSLRELLSAEKGRWTRKGNGLARYATVQAAVELTRRYVRDALTAGRALSEPQSRRRLLLAHLWDSAYQAFCGLYLQVRYRLPAFEKRFPGTDRQGLQRILRRPSADAQGLQRAPMNPRIDREPYGLYSIFGLHAFRQEPSMEKPLRRGAEEARAQLPELLTAAQRGQQTIITRHGRPVAMLAPISAKDEVSGQLSLLSLVGSGRGLYGEDSRETLRRLRQEWDR